MSKVRAEGASFIGFTASRFPSSALLPFLFGGLLIKAEY